MSSMVRPAFIAALAASALALPVGAAAQQASDWDRARASLVAEGPGPMAPQISRWERLYADTQAQLPFAEYSRFLIANPGFPEETRLRARAEERLRKEFVSNEELLAYFDRYPPVTNFSRAHYALALMGRDRNAAGDVALAAWRGGEMSETAEAMIASMYGDRKSVV